MSHGPALRLAKGGVQSFAILFTKNSSVPMISVAASTENEPGLLDVSSRFYTHARPSPLQVNSAQEVPPNKASTRGDVNSLLLLEPVDPITTRVTTRFRHLKLVFGYGRGMGRDLVLHC